MWTPSNKQLPGRCWMPAHHQSSGLHGALWNGARGRHDFSQAVETDRAEIFRSERYGGICGARRDQIARTLRTLHRARDSRRESEPSPDWLRKKLEALGQSSINNVVDATNYVLLETGQPLHAFDYEKLAEHRIEVRGAKPKEKIRTLDGVERTLTSGMCVIADASRAVAIAGVMGGAESEITSASRNVLLESACFDAISVRRTSKALGLRTEASSRFERGSDPEMAELASRRGAELIQQLAGGEILAGVVDVYPGSRPSVELSISRRELLRIMGADVPGVEIEAILAALGFAPKRLEGSDAESADAVWRCTQPSWRADVTREIDLIEEVIRQYGLDKFPSRLPASPLPAARLPHAETFDRVRERLIALGYQEIISITLVDAVRDAMFRPEGSCPWRWQILLRKMRA